MHRMGRQERAVLANANTVCAPGIIGQGLLVEPLQVSGQHRSGCRVCHGWRGISKAAALVLVFMIHTSCYRMYSRCFSNLQFARYQKYSTDEISDNQTYRMFLSLLCKLYNTKNGEIEVVGGRDRMGRSS